LEMCHKCGCVAFRNSYFQIVRCRACGWEVSLPQYEKDEAERKRRLKAQTQQRNELAVSS